MDDLTSRQAVIKAFSEWRDDDDRDLWQVIDEVPAAEPCEDAVSRKVLKDGFTEMCNLICPYTKKQQHVMCGSCLMGTAFDVLEATPPLTPKQRTGKWILDRSGAYCCSKCMEPCAGYVMMKPRDKFCKMCGAKMGVTE